MRLNQRTDDLAYENPTGFPEPSELPPLLSTDEYCDVFVKESTFPFRAAKVLFNRSGMPEFLQRLKCDESYYDHLLRTKDIRLSIPSLLTLDATIVLKDDPQRSDPILRATSLILGICQFYESLVSQRMQPDTYRGRPLEMGQYMNFFSTCLFPGGTSTRIFKSAHPSHIVVMIKGYVYVIHLYRSGVWLTDSEIEGQLRSIVSDAQKQAHNRSASLGLISCLNVVQRSRHLWTLRRNLSLRETLDVLSQAFFVVAIDLDSHPTAIADVTRAIHVGNFWNRWYLASTQLAVQANGKAGFIFSFPCGLDGNVMMRFAKEVQQSAAALSWKSTTEKKTIPFTRLHSTVPSKIANSANRDIHAFLDSTPVQFVIDGVGQSSFRPHQLSPDAAFNAALLYALGDLSGQYPSIMEHVSLSQYRNMGVGFAQVSTAEAIEFAKMLRAPTRKKNDLLSLLKAANESHKNALRRARNSMPLKWLTLLYLREATQNKKALAFLLALQSGGRRPDVLVSSPEPVDAIVACGRPGIRVPYITTLGVHYQIHDSKIAILFMLPSNRTNPPPERVAAKIEHGLRSIVEILEKKNQTTTTVPLGSL